jgi:hypothetical protein
MKTRLLSGGWRGWAGLVASPAAWAIHHQVGAYLNFTDCRTGGAAVIVLVGLACLAVALLGGWLSFGAWRALPETRGSPRFIATLGLMSGVLFSLTILMQMAAAAILPPCFR